MPPSKLPQNDENLPQLEAAVEAFAQAWTDSTTPPAIADYVDRCGKPYRHEFVVELVKIDIEQRWQSGLRRLLEDYATDIPELNEWITPQLVLEEFHARRLAGDEVQRHEYFARFPHLVPALEKLLVVDPILQTDSNTEQRLANERLLAPGDSIDDFDLLVELGRGAFATVFLARQRTMQRIVAVKISSDQGDEPQTLAQLDHNNIVRVFDQRTVPEQGLRLLYMQYAPGGTLAGVIDFVRTVPKVSWNGALYLRAIDRSLDSRGEFSSTESHIRQKIAAMSWPQVVCWVGSQLSRALDYAHRQGVLHRDLKPANILLTSDGIPKLADFNISFNSQLEDSSPEKHFGGSLPYMSPEQLEAICPSHHRTADSLDPQSDQFSLGVLVWELLTGTPPFPQDVDESGRFPLLKKMIARRHRGPDLIDKIPTEDRELLRVLRRCLSSQPENRYRNCLELAHEMDLCLQPDARELLCPSPGGWKSWVAGYPLFTVIMLTLVPNLVGAIFNFLYNYGEIVDRLPNAIPTFMRIQTIVNSVTFPVGILSSYWLAGSVTQATRITSQKKLLPQELMEQRRRCLNLGNLAAAVGLSLWLLAAPIYPLSLNWMLGAVPVEIYIDFIASLAICGLIAAAYPFFGVTLISIRCFYPSLVDWETMAADDRRGLERLMRQTWLYLVLAASVPMVAITILAIAEPESHVALIVLAAGGAIGYGITVTAFRFVQADLTTLIRTIWQDKS